MSDQPNETPRDVRTAVDALIKKGLRVVPLKPNTKEPYDDSWNTDLIFQAEDFSPDDNVGIKSVNGVVTIDEDALEAVQVAEAFMPKTGLVYGRPSKPRSKRLYLSTFEKTIAFKDHEGHTIIEVRSRHQDMAPPSVHPSGEQLAWDTFGDIESVDPEVLLKAARLVATCVLVIKSYAGAGDRHDWGLAWWGTLRHLGLTEQEVTRIAQEAGRVAEDKKVLDRVTEVRSTFARSDDTPLKSEGSLKEKTSAAIVDALKEVWGLRHRNVHGFNMTGKDHDKVDSSDPENIKLAIKKMKVKVAFNEFSERHIVYFKDGTIAKPLTDAIDRDLYFGLINKFHWRPPRELFTEVLLHIGDHFAFHPVQDYLTSLKWDGVPRLDTWIIRLGGAADTPYVRAVSGLPLLAACRRVMVPGSKFDEMLVLESGQGQGKSTALKTLCPFEEWFSSDLPLNSDSKEIIERTAGKWIIEAADLSGLKKADVEQLKATLSRETDNARMAYGRHVNERRRQWVIIGTTNASVYLKDVTGNRRFWPVKVLPFDLVALAAERDQLWAEAFHRERKGESIRLSSQLWEHAALQQERRRDIDPWENILGERLGTEAGDKDLRLTNEEVWAAVGVTDVSRYDSRGQHRLTEAMQRLGFKRSSFRVKSEGKTVVVRGWLREGKSPTLSLD